FRHPAQSSQEQLMALPNANWSYPTMIRFGAGRIAELPAVCREIGVERPLLVTDSALAAMPMVKEALAANEAAGVATGLFSSISPNPVGADVDSGVAAYASGGHDGVIAL